ncbi:MAG: phage BR0599 family protein [Tetrasphaera sp.]|nr:phage BR0599 family protein [Tetrasphaera sp.]
MSYTDDDKSVSDNAPIELYLFEIGAESYSMTSGNIPIQYSGKLFKPLAGLKRSSLKAITSQSSNTAVSIDVPITHDIVKKYGIQVTPPSIKITIYRWQRYTNNFIVYWSGPVSSISIKNEIATFKTPGQFGSSLNGTIPTVYIQAQCNNVLYDKNCKVPKGPNTLNATVTNISGRTIVLDSFGSFAADWFDGGEIALLPKNERRSITVQGPNYVQVNLAFTQLNIGDQVQLLAGCDHSFVGAKGCVKFANQDNFGGMPYVPGESNNLFVNGLK